MDDECWEHTKKKRSTFFFKKKKGQGVKNKSGWLNEKKTLGPV